VEKLCVEDIKGKKYKEILVELQDRLANYDDEEGIKRLLEFQRNFRQYSFQNCLMILFQCPDATRVAGLKAWNKMGRKVKKGETGIRIFAPCTKNVYVKTKVKEDEEEDAQLKKHKVQQLTGFKLVSVFDISQTTGEDIEGPSLHTPYSDHDELFQVLLSNSPIPVMIGRIEGINRETKGYFTPSSNHIKLSKNLEGDNRLLVLAHELSHYFTYKEIETRYAELPEAEKTRIHEITAEGATYIFCKEHEIDLRPSYQYLYSWTRRGEKSIIEHGELIRKTSIKLLALVEEPVSSAKDAAI